MNEPFGDTAKLADLPMRDALEAIKAHRDARDGGAPREEVKRLQLLADELYKAVIEYRLMLSEGLSDLSIDPPDHY